MTERRGGKGQSGLIPLQETRLIRELEKRARQQFAPPTPAQQRIIEASLCTDDEATAILFQHSALCQTFLPYRDPGQDIREWVRINGYVHLKVIAGEAADPVKQQLVPVGLPFGPKARVVLMHINQQAMLAQSPVIEVESTLTSFVRRALKFDTDGRTIRTVKDQLSRLSASSMRLAMFEGERGRTVNTSIIEGFDIWAKDDRQRTLWPSTIQLSTRYWESLSTHAVPLVEGHIGALSHNAMALDIYAWLAQRLHRVPSGKPALVAWPALHGQFSGDKGRLVDFRKAFRPALRQVLALYRDARIDDNEKGLVLHHSSPVVKPRLMALSG
jgi:hypothetical protein